MNTNRDPRKLAGTGSPNKMHLQVAIFGKSHSRSKDASFCGLDKNFVFKKKNGVFYLIIL